MAKAYCKFPRTGLGNLMLVWSRTIVFAKENNIPHVVDPWWGFRFGPILRGEKKKRLYWGYFKETSLLRLLTFHIYRRFAKNIPEPVLRRLTDEERNAAAVYTFNHVGDDYNLFGYIQGHIAMVKAELLNLLTPHIKHQYHATPAPCISIHVRRGDFKNGPMGLSKLTPTAYFIKAINMAREITGRNLPVTVFTDAHPSEIKELLDLPAVSLAPETSDIMDILTMGKSRMLILSRGSTFSYWGAFLSDALVIRQIDHQARIKDPSGNYFEVLWNNDGPEGDEQVRKAITKNKFD